MDWATALDTVLRRGYLWRMSEERAQGRHERGEEEAARNKTPDNVAGESMGSKVDPDFIPDESRENPDEERAREHPEETGS